MEGTARPRFSDTRATGRFRNAARRPLFALLTAILASGTGAGAIAAQGDNGPPARPGWIGVAVDVRQVTDGMGRRTVMTVADVQSGGPAARAGLRLGDVLLRIGDSSAEDALGAGESPLGLRVGERVRIVVSRDGRSRAFEVLAAERPGPRAPTSSRMFPAAPPDSLIESIMRAMDATRASLSAMEEALLRSAPPAGPAPDPRAPPRAAREALPSATEAGSRSARSSERIEAAPPPEMAPFSPLRPYLLGRNRVAGAEVVDLQPEMARYFGTGAGVLVVDVAPGTPAALAELLPGDVIVGLGGEPVSSVESLRAAVGHTGARLALDVLRRGERIGIELRR